MTVVVQDFHKTLLELRPDGSNAPEKLDPSTFYKLSESEQAVYSKRANKVGAKAIARPDIKAAKDNKTLNPVSERVSFLDKAKAIDETAFLGRLGIETVEFTPTLAINPLTLN